MTVTSLIKWLKDNDIELSLSGKDLEISYLGEELSADILQIIKDHKTELVDFLLDAPVLYNIAKAEPQDRYILSSAQRRLWILNQFEEAKAGYYMSGSFLLEGHIEFLSLETAFNQLIERHEILRTVFKEDQGGEVRQEIRQTSASKLTLGFTDLSDEPLREVLVKQLVEAEVSHPFDLRSGPLLRATLYQLSNSRWVFTTAMHHIICDGWSMGIFIKELFSFYNSNIRKEVNVLQPLRIQYKDYACWQQEQLKSDAMSLDKAYWLKQFEDDLPVLSLMGDRVRPSVKTFQGGVVKSVLGKEISEGLNSVLRKQGCTLFMGLIGAINALLYRYTDQTDIIIGSAIAGRGHIDLEHQIGFYVNTIALRTRFTGQDNYIELLEKVKEVSLGGFEHQMYPFDELVKDLNLQRDMSRNALFDVMVVLQNAESGRQAFQGNSELKIHPFEEQRSLASKFDINFIFTEEENNINVLVEYSSDIFTRSSAERLVVHLQQLIASAIKEPFKPIEDLEYLTEYEKYDLLFKFNTTKVPYRNTSTMVDLFEEQVKRTPDSVALVFGELTLSYQEVNARANRLARHILKSGVKQGDRIALLVSRGFEMVVGLYGILKAGATYVPVDVEYPLARQRYIIDNSEIRYIIYDGESDVEKSFNDLTLIPLNKLDLWSESDDNLAISIDSQGLAYIIYTSGSTGNPKGVMIEHHSAVNLIEWVNSQFDITKHDRLLFITSVCFDLSVYDIFGILSAGGAVVIAAEEDIKDSRKLISLLINQKITFWDSVPSTMKILTDTIESEYPDFVQDNLRIVFMSGDWIPLQLPNAIRKYFPVTKVISLGGATEATVWSNYFTVDHVEDHWRSIPYGKPIHNTRFYILDKNQQPVSQGVPGFLYIGGVGVARGYANDNVKTKLSFFKDPFLKELGETMYRTGDMGRMMESGNIEFLGRLDDQVKVRGYRVELGEVENHILKHTTLVREAIVSAKKINGQNLIVAYIIPTEEFDKKLLILKMKETLPDYMIPTYIIEIEHIPLSVNGKVDKKRLPDPVLSLPINVEYRAPKNDVERKLISIWEEVLTLEGIGVNSDFFEIGGHSLLAIKVQSEIKKHFSLNLPLNILFQNNNIEDLAKYILLVHTQNTGLHETVFDL